MKNLVTEPALTAAGVHSSSVPYSTQWYSQRSERTSRAAKATAPLLYELTFPSSVVDVGCGRGEWLTEFQRLGVERIFGIDGAHVDRSSLMVPQENFLAADLSQKVNLKQRFDLALCLEVAEHLPEQCAEAFVSTLVSLAPVIAFSAAIPGQPGTGHINCQWPNYWFRLFSTHGYTATDPVRRSLWRNPEIPIYYQRNLFVMVDVNAAANSTLCGELSFPPADQLTLIEPERLWQEPPSVRQAARELKRALVRAMRRRFPFFF